MLLPNERRSLEECLRPPVGFSLDCAIATTFSLDLLALLEAPLAFTMFEWQESGQRPRAADPIVLHGIRRYADRIHLFCQAGRIEVPSQYERLYTFIEDMVIEVLPPQQGVFHPKVWVLRLTSTEDAELPARYRLLCLSRNLLCRGLLLCLALLGMGTGPSPIAFRRS